MSAASAPSCTKWTTAFTPSPTRISLDCGRAPGGPTTRQTIHWAANCGYPVHMYWDTAGVIGDELPSEQCLNARLPRQALACIRPGTVVMMHLGIRSRRGLLAPILEPLIQGLKARGYCFSPLGTALPL